MKIGLRKAMAELEMNRNIEKVCYSETWDTSAKEMICEMSPRQIPIE